MSRAGCTSDTTASACLFASNITPPPLSVGTGICLSPFRGRISTALQVSRCFDVSFASFLSLSIPPVFTFFKPPHRQNFGCPFLFSTPHLSLSSQLLLCFSIGGCSLHWTSGVRFCCLPFPVPRFYPPLFHILNLTDFPSLFPPVKNFFFLRRKREFTLDPTWQPPSPILSVLAFSSMLFSSAQVYHSFRYFRTSLLLLECSGNSRF